MTRCSNYHHSDPAVYPHFEVYPKIQTVQSQAEAKSVDGGWGFKPHIHSDPKEVSKIQPWSFGWPSFRPVFPPTSTSPSVSTYISSPPLKSAMAYPVIEICEFSMTLDTVSNFLANCDTCRPCGLSFLRPVPRRATVHPRSTFRINPAAKVFGRSREVCGNETRLPGDKNM